MKALLFQLDGKLPNIALMRIAAHHRALGHEVELRRGKPEPQLWDEQPDFVYGSAIFQSTRSAAERLRLKVNYPQAIVGGTGCDQPPLATFRRKIPSPNPFVIIRADILACKVVLLCEPSRSSIRPGSQAFSTTKQNLQKCS